METQSVSGEVGELQNLISEQRRLLDALEGRLVDSPTDATAALVRRALSSRPARVARAEIRRAARASTSAVRDVRVAVPRGSDERALAAREVAEARRYTWYRADEAIDAIARG